jgi:hypothetical protein
VFSGLSNFFGKLKNYFDRKKLSCIGFDDSGSNPFTNNLETKSEKQIKKEFKTSFGVSPSHIKEVMDYTENPNRKYPSGDFTRKLHEHMGSFGQELLTKEEMLVKLKEMEDKGENPNSRGKI